MKKPKETIFVDLIQKVYEKTPSIGMPVKTLLWFIDKVSKSCIRNTDEIYAPVSQIAQEISMSVSQVHRHIKTLKSLGYIEQIRNNQQVYKLNLGRSNPTLSHPTHF